MPRIWRFDGTGESACWLGALVLVEHWGSVPRTHMNPHAGSPPSLTPVPGALTLSSVIYIHASQALIYIKITNKQTKKPRGISQWRRPNQTWIRPWA